MAEPLTPANGNASEATKDDVEMKDDGAFVGNLFENVLFNTNQITSSKL